VEPEVIRRADDGRVAVRVHPPAESGA